MQQHIYTFVKIIYTFSILYIQLYIIFTLVQKSVRIKLVIKMNDLRVKRTYLLLKNALFKLLSKKAFEEIKVNDLCDLAMVHRTTFYSHFSDKYELLEYCIKDVEEEISRKITSNTYSNTREFYTNLIMSLLEYISENRNFFKCILKNNSNNSVVSIFMNACISYITDMLEKEENMDISHEIPIPIIAQFYSGALINTIILWLKTNSKVTEKELCNYIISLIFDTPHKS